MFWSHWLQSNILVEAFQGGELEPPLFDDVLPALQQWKQHGIKLFTYSSLGSDAQRRFFRCTQVRETGRLQHCSWKWSIQTEVLILWFGIYLNLITYTANCVQVGDVGKLISGYFDMSVGAKNQSASYEEIALILGVKNAACVTFLTDIVDEANAAKEAGMNCLLCLRPGNAKIVGDHGVETIKSFDSLTAQWVQGWLMCCRIQ